MYIMCVCLFSALSRRVGALQISIIVININFVVLAAVHGILGPPGWCLRLSLHSFVDLPCPRP